MALRCIDFTRFSNGRFEDVKVFELQKRYLCLPCTLVGMLIDKFAFHPL